MNPAFVVNDIPGAPITALRVLQYYPMLPGGQVYACVLICIKGPDTPRNLSPLSGFVVTAYQMSAERRGDQPTEEPTDSRVYHHGFEVQPSWSLMGAHPNLL